MVRIIRRIVGIVSLLCLLPCHAAEQFLPDTADIPLMDGLKVEKTDNINFDTPAGQIIAIDAVAPRLNGNDVLAYYQEALPEMGWTLTDANRFVREKDSLAIRVIRSQRPARVRFELTTANTN